MAIADLRRAMALIDSRIIGRTTGELMEKWGVTEKQLLKVAAEFGVMQRPSQLWTYPPGTQTNHNVVESPEVEPTSPETLSPDRVSSDPCPVSPEPTSPPAGFNLMDFMK